MADIYSLLTGDEPTAQDQARAMAEALRRQKTAALLGQLSGDKVLGGVGEHLQRQAGLEEGLGARLLETRKHYQTQEQIARENKAAALAQAQQQQAWRSQEATQQQNWRSQESARQRELMSELAKERAATASAIRADKPLTESQGQAAMFLKQGESALEQAMAMGPGIFPAAGAAGALESMAWKARTAGLPQLSSREQQARQSILLSIAEPIVRAESGAAVPESEVARLATRYIPMPGETEEEHQRKLGSLIRAIEAVGQKLPESKAAEFRPFYEKAKAWAATYKKPAAPRTSSETAPGSVASPKRIKVDADGNIIP